VRRYWWIKRVAAFLVLAPLVVAALSFVVMSLWDALVPSLFSGPVIGFWQAVGLLVLCRILFGGFRGRGGGHHGWKQHWAMHERWHRMSPQERERFREDWRNWRDMSHEQRREWRRGFCGSGVHERGGAGAGGDMADDGARPKEGFR
jgi:hypothetical protein